MELTVADEAKLHEVEHHMIRMMSGVKLVDWVSTDVLRDRAGVVVKIRDMIIKSRMWWHDYVICRDINSQIREVMELEINEKSKKGRSKKLWEERVKKDLE